MKIKLNSITGIDDAIATMFISRHKWTEELDEDIRKTVAGATSRNGRMWRADEVEAEYNWQEEVLDKYLGWLKSITRFGEKHITLLKFVDLSISVRGLHRAGQDDWDAHAKRFDNRIIRNSSRFAGIEDESHLQNMSDYYADKVLTTDAALKILKNELPEKIEYGGETYVRAFNGYIKEGYENNQDVKRGLYNLGFPSDFLFKCNLTEFAHVYKERGEHGGANPEVKQCAEMIADAIEDFQPIFTRDLLMAIKN